MTFSDQIKERKEIVELSCQVACADQDLLVTSLELRIMELESDLDNAREDLELEQALTKKLKGLLDGGLVDLCGELVTALESTMMYIDADAVLKCHAGPVRAVLTKAKEVTP